MKNKFRKFVWFSIDESKLTVLRKQERTLKKEIEKKTFYYDYYRKI